MFLLFEMHACPGARCMGFTLMCGRNTPPHCMPVLIKQPWAWFLETPPSEGKKKGWGPSLTLRITVVFLMGPPCVTYSRASNTRIIPEQHNAYISSRLPPSILILQLLTGRQWLHILWVGLLSLNLHNLSGPREAAGSDRISTQVKVKRWVIHEAVCEVPSWRLISHLSACARSEVAQRRVSLWGFCKQVLCVLFRCLSHKDSVLSFSFFFVFIACSVLKSCVHILTSSGSFHASMCGETAKTFN